MFRFIVTLLMALAGFVMYCTGDLAYSYMFTTGYGLHPLIAGLMLALLTLCLIALGRLLYEDLRQRKHTGLQYVSHEILTGIDPVEARETWKLRK